MNEDPLVAIRRKKDASLVVGMGLLAKKQIDAFVTCGNTGALIACARLFLPLLSGVTRPALLVSLPTKTGLVSVLDVGGNISCKAQDFVQFALLGAAYQRTIHGVKHPRVGLLNIGVESKKGTAELRQAYELLQQTDGIHFVGNVEGRNIFTGVIDVLVTDGFSGNVMLKTAEGVASLILDALNAAEDYSALRKQFNYTEYPGAIVCGVEGVAMKVHGNATAETLLVSILSAPNIVIHQH